MTSIERATPNVNPTGFSAAQKRRARKSLPSKSIVLSPSIHSGETGAEAIRRSLPNSVMPRQSTRAVHSSIDSRSHNDSAADQDIMTPSDQCPDPQSNPGHLDIVSQMTHAGTDASDDGVLTEGNVSPIIARIQQLWRMRQRWHRAEKSLILQGRAVCRSWANGDKDVANDLFDTIQGGGSDDAMLEMALMPFLSAVQQFEPTRKAIEKELRKSAQSLDIYPWVKGIKGFGDLNLAALVGECGDIGSYRNPACLWKRMGLAVIDGERQRKKSDAAAALAHGYNPRRRAVAYLLADCLVKGNGEGEYRQLYLNRKNIEITRVATKAHAHNRAARYMIKRVLRHLHSAWRQVEK